MTAALPTRRVPKPWGRTDLPVPFDGPEKEAIGEIWFEPPAALDDLLIKYLFTSENLSVQVHPSDEQTQARGLGRQGKEECWLILDAEPGACLAIGFNEPIDADAMRAAALDGSIEHMLTRHPVQAGDFFYVPANTVHAIGAGISLIEVQQNSDITYRLYDYGRPRELHLDDGIAVAEGRRYDVARWRKRAAAGNTETLVDGPHFRLDTVAGAIGPGLRARYADGPLLVVPRTGEVSIAGEPISPGACGLATSIDEVTIGDAATCLIAQPIR